MQATLAQYIEIRKNRRGKDRAFIVGTRVRVQDIVSDHERHGLFPEDIARQYPQLSLAQVHSALAFYFDNKEEVWGCIHDDASFADSMRQQLESQSATDG